MFQGIWAHKFSPERLNTEIEVGFEQVQAANHIFNETVPGIVFPTNVAFGELLEKENIIKTVSARARKQNLTMGVRVYDCHTAMAQAETGHFEMIRNLVALYDFIICQMIPPAANYSLGPERFFKEITKEFSEIVKAVKLIGNGTQVILESGWACASNESNSKETTELKWFWERMGQWANAEKQNVFMADAFDNPWKNAANQLAAHYGLWMHLDTDNNSKEAYVRKVPDLHIQKYRKPQPPPISVGLDGNNKTKTATKSQVSEGHAGSNKTTVKPKLYYATRNGADAWK
ncbi:hypothetical protein Ocin01_17158 [Orchesella cincta]|uniref:Glucan 1,3-beta-glucosidase n=1 Tax=Orchesella cincta TaxID=48709 RepID=A0A1D2M9E6_ORCCI|nr:hypothetical protein Ocin01_17158 [Orchesella cincta]